LGAISTFGTTNTKIKCSAVSAETWLLELEDIEKDSGKILQRICVRQRNAIGEKAQFHKGEILYSKLRPYLKKVVVADRDGICSSEIIPFRMIANQNAEYYRLLLVSPYVDRLVNAATYGVKMPRVGTDTMINLLLPLPPLAEQKRIVAKIEELLPYINQLREAK
jgi:type I restriction enzyme S subunit